MGPFGPAANGGRLLTFSVRAGALYDSNAAQGTEDVRGLSKSDVVYTVDGAIQAVRRLGTFDVFLQGGAGYVEHSRNDALSSSRVNLQGGVTKRFGQCGASVYDHVEHRQTDLRELNVRVTQNRQTDNTLGVNLECAPAASLRASLAGAFTTTRNSEAGSVPESDVEKVTAALGYARSGLGSIEVTGRYEGINYLQDPTLPRLLQPADVIIRGVGLAYQRPIGARLSGRGEVSHVEVRAIDRFSGVASDVEFTYRPSRRLELIVRYQRDIAPTLQTGSSFVVNTGWRTEAVYKISPRTVVNISASRTENRYRNLVLVFSSPSRDEMTTIFTSIQTKLGRRVDVELSAAYDKRDTNVASFDYSGYKVGIFLSTTL